MKWKKLGLIYCSDSKNNSTFSHAMLPFAKNLSGSIFRIYFSTRDQSNRSHGACLEIDLHDPKNILVISKEPILGPGKKGLFDDSGVTLSSEISIKGESYLYYTGWSLPGNVPFQTFCGLAKYNQQNNKFEKVSTSPILGRSEIDPVSIGFVQVLEHEDKFKMWYESNTGWTLNQGRNVCKFVIKYAESTDGFHWQRLNIDCIKLEKDEELVSRPSVLIEESGYSMWYSLKKNSKYTLGYATSGDGKNWERKDSEVGIAPSGDGWDGEEVEYPFVFVHQDEKYMLYNGNGYGKTGFGLAKLVK